MSGQATLSGFEPGVRIWDGEGRQRCASCSSEIKFGRCLRCKGLGVTALELGPPMPLCSHGRPLPQLTSGGYLAACFCR